MVSTLFASIVFFPWLDFCWKEARSAQSQELVGAHLSAAGTSCCSFNSSSFAVRESAAKLQVHAAPGGRALKRVSACVVVMACLCGLCEENAFGCSCFMMCAAETTGQFID